MKKYFPTYGVLFLYLVFAYGLDRIVFEVMTSPQNYSEFNRYEYQARSIFWVVFAVGSFIFIWHCITKLTGDSQFFSIQVVLGLFGIFSPIFMPQNWSNYPFIGRFAFLFFSAGTGALTMALTFVGGLGAVGLLKIYSEKKKGGLKGGNR